VDFWGFFGDFLGILGGFLGQRERERRGGPMDGLDHSRICVTVQLNNLNELLID
jgi:hypothetical protein